MKIRTIITAIFTAIMPIAACATDNEPKVTNNSDFMIINITIDGKTLTANLVDNSSTKGLVEKLRQGSVTYAANDYGGFEKVGALGFSLPRNDQDVTTSPGDIILYQGNNLCLYYARNTWDFTPMGKINYQSEDELCDFLKAGKGQIIATLSLPESNGISGINSENSDATEYYTLSGTKAGSDAKGVLVAKNGNKKSARSLF